MSQPISSLGKHEKRIAYISHYSHSLLKIVISTAVFILGCWAFFLLLPFSTLIAAIPIGLFLAYAAWNIAEKIPFNEISAPISGNNIVREATVDIKTKGLGIHFRYMIALVGLGVLFALLIIFSPVAATFSVPMIGLVSLFSAFTFLNAFYVNNSKDQNFKGQLETDDRTSTASMISKRVLINVIMLGFLVVVFSSILSPFIFFACVLGALAFSRIFCEPFVIDFDNKMKRLSNDAIVNKPKILGEHLGLAIAGISHMSSKTLRVSLVPFLLFVALFFFAPPIAIGITFGWPVILAASAIAALAFGRVFFHTRRQPRRALLKSSGFHGLCITIALAGIIIAAALLFTSMPFTALLTLAALAGSGIVVLCIYRITCHYDYKHLEEDKDLTFTTKKGVTVYDNSVQVVSNLYCPLYISYGVAKVIEGVADLLALGNLVRDDKGRAACDSIMPPAGGDDDGVCVHHH